MSHWYTKEGEACHYIDGRDTTLRDARKLDLVPSVTEILNIQDKPGLTKYFINQHLKAAWNWGVNHPEAAPTFEDWSKEVKDRASEHSTTARDRGILIHDSLEKVFQGHYDVPDRDLIYSVKDAIEGVYGIHGWDTEKTFSTQEYGGTVDLSHPEVILDYKYKTDGWELKKDGTPKKMWYDSHAAQLAAYREGLGYDCKCANVFIKDDGCYIHEWSEEDLKQGISIFDASLTLWQAIKRF